MFLSCWTRFVVSLAQESFYMRQTCLAQFHFSVATFQVASIIFVRFIVFLTQSVILIPVISILFNNTYIFLYYIIYTFLPAKMIYPTIPPQDRPTIA